MQNRVKNSLGSSDWGAVRTFANCHHRIGWRTEDVTTWLYAASDALASATDTLSLAFGSGFVWRSFYNGVGIPIACVKQIQPGDDLVLGYRSGGAVRLLARFRVGRPAKPILGSQVFGQIPAVWTDSFQRHGYRADPILGFLVGIFVEEGQPLTGQLPYSKQNALSKLGPDASASLASGGIRASPAVGTTPQPLPVLASSWPRTGTAETLYDKPSAHDGVHVGIDVGGRPEKGFDLCITEWVSGELRVVRWKRLPHPVSLPNTSALRPLIARGDLASFAALTQVTASAVAEALWSEIQQVGATGVHIDSPSAFSRNRLGHGRLCEKRSLTGVFTQSTPSIACGHEHGGDWGWLVYGMVAFAACLHRGLLTNGDWIADLQSGTFTRSDSSGIVLRECFPTATFSVLRAQRRESDIERALGRQSQRPEVLAVLRYLESGVQEVKRPGDALYDRADAPVAALGALPHVGQGFRELPIWGPRGSRWSAAPDDERIEGTFMCVE
jgi:hypothetical protein